MAFGGTKEWDEMSPCDILYTQESIRNVFGRPDQHQGRYIGETLDELLEGRITVRDIYPIRVFRHNGSWWSLDNRRLWVFRQFQALGGCEKIPVKVVRRKDMGDWKFTAIDGQEVEVRGPERSKRKENDRQRQRWWDDWLMAHLFEPHPNLHRICVVLLFLLVLTLEWRWIYNI